MKKALLIIVIVVVLVGCGLYTFNGESDRSVYVEYCSQALSKSDETNVTEKCGNEFDNSAPDKIVTNLETYGSIVNG